VLKRIWNYLFSNEVNINLNLNIEIKDLGKITEVLSTLQSRSVVKKDYEVFDDNSKNTLHERKSNNIISKKESLKEDPITANDIADLMKSTGIEKGVDKTGDIYSKSNGSSIASQVSSLKRIKEKGK